MNPPGPAATLGGHGNRRNFEDLVPWGLILSDGVKLAMVTEQETLEAKILTLFKKQKTGLSGTCAEVAGAIGCDSWSAMSEALRHLVQEGKVCRAWPRGQKWPRYSAKPPRPPRVSHPPVKAADVRPIFQGSDSGATSRLHNTLKRLGPKGQLAALLLRAQKRSDRAKAYKGDWRGVGYEEKDAALREACALLLKQPGILDRWGWGYDPASTYNSDVLYLELPTGQVSFHAAMRHEGPDYAGNWDGSKLSQERILRFAERLLGESGPAKAGNAGS